MIAQVHVEEEISRLGALYEREVESFASRVQASAEAEGAFRKEYACSFLAATGAQHLREQEARKALSGLYHHWKICEAEVEASKSRQRFFQAQLSALQTLAANQRNHV